MFGWFKNKGEEDEGHALAKVEDNDPDAPRDRILLGGEIPSPMSPPSGCVFRTRCPHAIEACAREVPALEARAPGHMSACLRAAELA